MQETAPILEIKIRPTRESHEQDEDFRDSAESADPDKINPIDYQMGFDTDTISVQSGEAFNIPPCYEGDLAENVALLDQRGRKIFRDEAWALSSGQYTYDGTAVKIIKLDSPHRD